ncbi:MAG: DUF3857 domain-containing protein [Bacteroidales bacterium]|nr:DUF3857 domain-containing protein [Bacteroidales bacterium]
MRKIQLLKRTLLFILFIQISLFSYSQKAPMKFGKIDIEDLKMTVYENDTTAEAVILCDYGVFTPESIEFTRRCRIKILKKEGARWANNRINSSAKIILKARTYNLVNGEIEVTKMKNESVYEVYVEDRRIATKFSMPNVKVGSIIEFQYTKPGIPYEWRFQDVIPVKWSELRWVQHDHVKFQKYFFGFEPLSIIEKSRWVGENMPAFREEAYMNSYTNYITKFEFDIVRIGIYEYSTSWEKVNETLLDNRYFGGRLESNLFLNNEAKMIKELDLSDLEKAKRAFELVKNTITWNEACRKSAYSPLNYTYNTKKNGSSAEINITLISLLDKIGLEVEPVILSTRDNGILSPIFPSINKPNYVIARLKLNDKDYFLDATDKLAPFGLLPKRCINGDGRTIVKDNTNWITIGTPVKSKEIIYSKLEMLDNGDINGSISNKLFDYAAYDFRKILEDYTTQDDFIKDIESEFAGLIINDYEFENIEDIYKPVVLKYDISLQNNVDIIGNNIYLNPMLFEKMDDNPFKIEDRIYPVDYIHPIEKSYILSLTIPEGYIVDQLPKPYKAALPNNTGVFIYSINHSGQNIQLTYKFNINNPIFLPGEYKQLKQFYDLIINKHSEMIILKKTNS